MTDVPAEPTVRDHALAALLAHHPEAVLSALAPNGFRIATPASVGLSAEQQIPVPADPATLVDVAVPADGMQVISLWERATRTGLAVGNIRTRTDPDRTVVLTFIDMQHRHGVMLAALTDPQTGDEVTDGGRLDPALLAPLRPRTATVRKTAHAIITAVDERTTRMLGWTAAEMVGLRTTEFIHPDDHERAIANWMEMLAKQQSQRVRFRHRDKAGGWLWVEVENEYQHAEDFADVVVISRMSDISDEMAAYEALDQREKLFRRLAESLPIGLLQLAPDGALVYANARLAEITGVPAARTVAEQLGTVVAADRPTVEAALADTLQHGRDQQVEVEVQVPATRQPRRCAVSLVALTDSDGAPGALVCVSDITESARMREELKVKATFDVLTGCYNRASVLAVLDQALAAGDGTTGVIFVDLNRFKPINDTLGHAAGDELLVHTARQLTGSLRADDVVGRFGGDEFLLVCRRLAGPAEALALAERVRAALHQQVRLAAGTVDLAASIGVACAEPGIDSDALIARADAAMYESKREGLGRPVVHGAAAPGSRAVA